MDYAEKGAKALEASDANAAILSYTKALIEHPFSPDFWTQRSIAFTKLKPSRHDLALQDAEFAVLSGQDRGRRDKIQAGQHRRMVAYYNLGQYANAKVILDSMLRWRSKSEGKLAKKEQMEHDIWSSKINGKLKDSLPQTTEYPSFKLPNEKEMKSTLHKQLKDDGTFNFDGQEVTVKETPTSIQEPTLPTQAPPQKIRHEWYQNNQNVIITIYAKGVPKDQTEITIAEDSITIAFPNPSNPAATFELTFDPLFALIDPQNSKFQVMSTKIEITLAKMTAGQKWANIEGSEPLQKSEIQAEKVFVPNVQPQGPSPAYPTSSRSGPKNWDKLADDLTKKKGKKKEGDSPDDGYDSDVGGDEVDGFFKKLYAGSDEATRRAMIKSFTESNGTALSTNWSDVGSRTVDPVKSKDEE